MPKKAHFAIGHFHDLLEQFDSALLNLLVWKQVNEVGDKLSAELLEGHLVSMLSLDLGTRCVQGEGLRIKFDLVQLSFGQLLFGGLLELEEGVERLTIASLDSHQLVEVQETGLVDGVIMLLALLKKGLDDLRELLGAAHCYLVEGQE